MFSIYIYLLYQLSWGFSPYVVDVKVFKLVLVDISYGILPKLKTNHNLNPSIFILHKLRSHPCEFTLPVALAHLRHI
jgi:hypothetical protein